MIIQPLIPAQAGIQGRPQRAGSPPEFTPDVIGGGDERRFGILLCAYPARASFGAPALMPVSATTQFRPADLAR